MNYFKTYKDLGEYQLLTFEERLRGYLFEKEIIKIPLQKISFEQDPIINIEVEEAEIKFASTLKDGRVRKGLWEKLLKVNKNLSKNGLGLKIYEMYRPLAQQKKEFAEIKLEMGNKFPKLNENELWAKTTEFIADPELCPPHSTGGAVDLTLINLQTGIELEMGTLVNALESEAALFHPDISPIAIENRRILLEAMLAEKLAPMCTEWWHFSYGEAYWAAVYGVARIYESLDL